MDEWWAGLGQDVTIEADGKAIPARDHEFVKNTPDMATFVKRAWDAHSEVGRRIPLKADTPEAKAQWAKDNMPKLYDAGLLRRPVADPKDYKIDRPESIPEGLAWSEAVETKFRAVAHKHGIPQEAIPELLALQAEAMQDGVKKFRGSYDEGVAHLKKELGAEYDTRMEQIKRFTPHVIKNEEDLAFLEASGWGDHPAFLSIMARLAPFIEQDSSMMEKIGDGATNKGGMTGEQVKAELNKVMTDKTHPDHAKYWANDPETHKKYDDMYKKAYGDTKIQIGGVVMNTQT